MLRDFQVMFQTSSENCEKLSSYWFHCCKESQYSDLVNSICVILGKIYVIFLKEIGWKYFCRYLTISDDQSHRHDNYIFVDSGNMTFYICLNICLIGLNALIFPASQVKLNVKKPQL